MSDKELVDKIVMFRTELERQNAGMGIMSLFDTICSYYGEQHRAIKGHLTTIESQKEEIEKLKNNVNFKNHVIASLENDRELKNKRESDLLVEIIDKDVLIESLKAITELAVKTLTEIATEHFGSANSARWQQLTRDTLTEIEILTNLQEGGK